MIRFIFLKDYTGSVRKIGKGLGAQLEKGGPGNIPGER